MGLLFTGLIHVTGEHDAGKSRFALEVGVPPEQMVVLDDDIKGRDIVNQLAIIKQAFGDYHDLVAESKGMRELQFHEHVMRILAGYKPKQYSVLIFDTWSRFEDTFKPVVTRDPKRFREFYSPMGTIKGAEEWNASFDYEAQVLTQLLGVFDLVVLVTHLKQYNVGNKRIEGKFVPRCKNPVVEKSLFRLWLRLNSNSPVPIGLVLKRLNKTVVTDRGIRTVNILPRKVTPRSGDESLWDTINWYWDNPYGIRPPTADETPNEFELSILEGTLTADQKVALQLALMEAAEDAGGSRMTQQQAPFMDPSREPTEEDVAEIKRLVVEGVLTKDIAFRVNLPLPKVLKVVK